MAKQSKLRPNRHVCRYCDKPWTHASCNEQCVIQHPALSCDICAVYKHKYGIPFDGFQFVDEFAEWVQSVREEHE